MAMVLMAVFVPIGFMGGMTGVMYKQFAVCIAVSIALSAICALTLSPAMCSHFLGQQTKDKPAKTPLMAHLKHIQSRIAKRTDVIVKKFNDEPIKEYVSEFKNNLKELDDCLFVKITEEFGKLHDTKEFDKLLNLDQYDENQAERILNLIAVFSTIVCKHLQSSIEKLVELYERF